MIDLAGKRVLVTGGTRGIGNAIASAFLAAGAQVAITGTRPTAHEYSGDLSGFVYHQLDMQSRDSADMVDLAGPIDVLVNNAAMSNRDEYELEGFRRTIETNLVGVMDLCLAFRDTLAERRGAIVNVGSVAAHLSLREIPGYTASKGGLLGLTRALADKWAPLGIRVNMLAPGFVRTEMTERLREDERHEKRLLATVPMRRWAEPAEIAGAALFLASDLASYITGISLPIDGGLMVR